MMPADKAFYISIGAGALLAHTLFSDVKVTSHYVQKDHAARQAWSIAVLFSFGAFIFREGSHIPPILHVVRFALAWQPLFFKDIRDPYIILGLIFVTVFIYEYSSPIARLFMLPMIAWYGFIFGSIYKDKIVGVTRRVQSTLLQLRK